MNIFISILSSYGLAMIITKSYILKEFREYLTLKSAKLGVMISCPQCIGLYCGILLSLFLSYDIQQIVCVSLATSGICYTINKI